MSHNFPKPHILVVAETNPVVRQQVIEEVGPRLLEIVTTASWKRALDRYSIKRGRIFGNPRDSKERYRILDVFGNSVSYRDLKKERNYSKQIDELLEWWFKDGIIEISPIDDILKKLKEYLTPLLGIGMVSGLISWLLKKLGGR